MGIFFISMIQRKDIDKFLKEFPSPMGIFFISISIEHFTTQEEEAVSVPYGDLFYFYFKNLLNNVRINKFPSPTGIFFVSIPDHIVLKETKDDRFPSPTGIFFVSIRTILH